MDNTLVAGKYPEHEKLGKVQDKSQAIGEFIEFGGFVLCVPHEHKCECYEDYDKEVCDVEPCDASEHHRQDLVCGYGDYQPVLKSVPSILAEWFKIDEKRLEDEKQAMLEEIRKGG